MHKLFVLVLLSFLAVHAEIAFAFQPTQTDPRLYALYAFVFADAQRVGRLALAPSQVDSFRQLSGHRNQVFAANNKDPRLATNARLLLG
jgi:hypothetical protein